MGEKIVVGPVNKGLRNDREPFVIDNDSFPILINAYQWRGRLKRKRGTSLLNRLQRFWNSLSGSYNPGFATQTLGNDGSGNGTGNLFTGFAGSFFQPNATIEPGTVTINDETTSIVYTDPGEAGILVGTPSGSGTINYITGQILITGAAGDTIDANFVYYPDLPVMGLEDLILSSSAFPGTIAFDTTYAYNIVTSAPYNIYDVSFYKNPPTNTYPSYVQKTIVTPTTWNGQDYQQFWTTNYQGALWATNGINVPFSIENIGMQYMPIVASTVIDTGPPAIVNLQIMGHGLSVGDFLFINETTTSGLTGLITAATQTNPVSITSANHGLTTGNMVTISGVVGMTQLNGNTYTITVTGANTFTLNGTLGATFSPYISGGVWTSPSSEHPGDISGLNFQTGYVTAVIDPNNVTVEFPNATITMNSVGGIAQYLTNRANPLLDSLRWYDGDPTNGSATQPVLNGNLGWVNFAPPLSKGIYSISNLPAAQYYLVGARIILPFKDRLLFFGPVIQSSIAGSQVYLQDTIIYSQNGTVYYTASFTGDPSFATTIYNPILVPIGQTATASAYFEDQTGFGGFITAGLDQAITTASPNEDVLIVGFNSTFQTRLIYSGNDIVPFNFFVTNSELGSASTFSAITMDEGVISRGNRGFVITSQVRADRIDLEIPDEVFEINLISNGNERFCAQRDFISEWIYFTYPVNAISYKFPNQTLQYNYRDQSWGIFQECYTTYGSFRALTGYTWATIGEKFASWSVWNEPWNAGSSTLLQPKIIGGNQQGFVLLREDGTNESVSLYIENISFPAIITNITKAAEAVITANNQFIVGQQVTFSGVVGMTQINNLTETIVAATSTQFTISLNTSGAGFSAYISGGIAIPLEPIYSPNHCLNNGDYIVISGVLGTIGPFVNNQIFSVALPTTNGFSLNPPLTATGTYIGGGLIQRMYIPFIQSKQFPVSWANGRKTRLGPQQYLLSATSSSQITLLIFLSEDIDNAYNNLEYPYAVDIVPQISENNTLIYNTTLYTCPESTNLGLTPANINLNMVTAQSQQQIWHRINTSLLGDTVQVGFTMNDVQMRSLTPSTLSFIITGATNAATCVLTSINMLAAGQLVLITGILGMTQLNNNVYFVISATSSTITINVNSTTFGTYISGGVATVVTPINQFAEIEIHGFILDVNQSMVLA
jgi:hypothetical protein